MNRDELDMHDCHLSPEDSCDCVKFRKDVDIEPTTQEELMDDNSADEEPQIDDVNPDAYEPRD